MALCSHFASFGIRYAATLVALKRHDSEKGEIAWVP